MANDKATDPISRLAAIEAKRAERAASVNSAAEEQLATDLEAIYEHELKYDRVGLLKLPYTAGSPMRAACRAANDSEVNRYRARVKPNKKGELDADAAHAAAVELGITCQLYPEKGSPLDQAMRASHKAADHALGLIALRLAGAEEVEKGKD